jgi:DNA polymerase/3'-5' exonuclease PolX
MKVMYKISDGAINGFGDSFKGYDESIYRVTDISKLSITMEEKNVSEINGFGEVKAVQDYIISEMQKFISEVNAKYKDLNVTLMDTEKEAGIKMVMSGVTYEDAEFYGGRLKLLKGLL